MANTENETKETGLQKRETLEMLELEDVADVLAGENALVE